jgi:hypothetical protein
LKGHLGYIGEMVKLSRPGGVSPTYIPSIETEHAGGDDQIIRDPVPGDSVPAGVSVEKGDTGRVAAGVTPGAWAGSPGNVLVEAPAVSGGEEEVIHPEQHVKKMMNPARNTGKTNE